MNQKKIESYISQAITLIEDKLEKNGIVDKVYNGYISNFGISVRQSGLLPALAFYEGEGEREGNPAVLMGIILDLIKNDDIGCSSLLNYVLEMGGNTPSGPRITKRVLEAATAVKLALRTFKIEEKGKENE